MRLWLIRQRYAHSNLRPKGAPRKKNEKNGHNRKAPRTMSGIHTTAHVSSIPIYSSSWDPYLKKRQHRHQPYVDFVEDASLLLRRNTRQPFGILSSHTRLDLMRCRLGFLVDRDAVVIDIFDHCCVAFGGHLDGRPSPMTRAGPRSSSKLWYFNRWKHPA